MLIKQKPTLNRCVCAIFIVWSIVASYGSQSYKPVQAFSHQTTTDSAKKAAALRVSCITCGSISPTRVLLAIRSTDRAQTNRYPRPRETQAQAKLHHANLGYKILPWGSCYRYTCMRNFILYKYFEAFSFFRPSPLTPTKKRQYYTSSNNCLKEGRSPQHLTRLLSLSSQKATGPADDTRRQLLLSCSTGTVARGLGEPNRTGRASGHHHLAAI